MPGVNRALPRNPARSPSLARVHVTGRLKVTGRLHGRATAVVPAAAAALLLAGAVPAGAEPLQLPTPQQAQATVGQLLTAVQARPDRGLRSVVPGPAVNDELVLVGMDGGGTPVRVELEQHVRLTGSGDYQVRERGPARAARSLSEESAPVTKLGAVVWQGFTPGDRELAALLTLDPPLERPRLPLQVSVAWTPAGGGAPRPLEPGGRVPGPGTVVVEVADRTGQPTDLPTAADADPAGLAPALDAVLAIAAGPAGPRLPVTGAALPATVEVTGPARTAGRQDVPLRLTGTLTLPGATVRGPGTTGLPDGARVAGTLGAAPARFELLAPAAGDLALDLTAVPALDARALVPPDGLPSWAAWAASSPDLAARRVALDLLVQVAATGARATSLSPYLGADLPGTGSTRFRYSFVAPQQAVAVRPPLQVRPGAVGLAGVAGLLVLTGAYGVWRRS